MSIKTLQVRLPPDVYARLDAVAEERDVSRSYLVRKALEGYFRKLDTDLELELAGDE